MPPEPTPATTPADLWQALQAAFPTAGLTGTGTGLEPHAEVPVEWLVPVMAFLRDDPACQCGILNDISGVDFLEPDPKKASKAGFEPHLEVVYHLSSFTKPGLRFTIKVKLPRELDPPPRLPTLSGLWATADWQEREVYDFFGVQFTGHPDLRRILLSDDWVGHPLRKDYEFPQEYQGIRCR